MLGFASLSARTAGIVALSALVFALSGLSVAQSPAGSWTLPAPLRRLGHCAPESLLHNRALEREGPDVAS